MTQKELLTALKEWQKKKEIPKFDTKCLLTHDLKRTSKVLYRCICLCGIHRSSTFVHLLGRNHLAS